MKKNVIKTFSTVFIITLISKVLGLLRDIIFAKYYGTGFEATAFFAATRIPTQLLDIGLSAAITSTFIPVFNEVIEKKSKEEANKFANNFINIIALIATVISIIGIAFAPQVVNLLAGGFDEQTFNLTVELVRITFPMIIFTAVAFSFVGLLQSYGEFNIPAMISSISNIIIIGYIVLFREKFGIHGVASAMLIAWAFQVIIQIPFAIKNGYKFKAKVNFRDEYIKKVFRIALPIIISTSVLPINNLVSTRLASCMEDGAVSALEYAYKLYIVIVGVFTYAIGNIIFPELARLSVNEEKEKYISMVKKGIKIMCALLIPLTIGIAIYRTDIIKIIYQRGAFDERSTALTSGVLLCYAIGMIGFGVVEIMNKSFYAKQNTKTPLIVGMCIVIFNVALSMLLSRLVGLNGLALATAITSITNAIVLTLCSNSENKGMVSKDLIGNILKVILASIIMGLSVYLVNNVLATKLIGGMIIELVRVAIGVVIGVIIYLIFANILKVEEMQDLKDFVDKAVHKKQIKEE